VDAGGEQGLDEQPLRVAHVGRIATLSHVRCLTFHAGEDFEGGLDPAELFQDQADPLVRRLALGMRAMIPVMTLVIRCSSVVKIARS
jgi:hypothetical protein